MLFFGFPDLQRKMLTHFPAFANVFRWISINLLRFFSALLMPFMPFARVFPGFSLVSLDRIVLSLSRGSVLFLGSQIFKEKC